MTRTDNIKRNMIFNIIKYVASLLLQFALRTALIYTLGAEYIGLNGLFSNIFNFLNLAELGIGSAIIFSMYKPIAEGDTQKVIALQNLYKKYYLIIAIVVLVLGGVLIPFLNIFVNYDTTVNINIFLLYVMYLFNAVIGYFSAHKRSLLFAYQRSDIENKIKTICLFIMTIVQILVLVLFKNYYLFYIMTILFTIVECFVVHIQANKLLPEITGKGCNIDADTKKQITRNVFALSLHKIGGAVVFSTDNILVSMFAGIVVLGAYSNYALIITSLSSLFTLVNNAFAGSVGNLIASSSIDYVKNRFNILNWLYATISGFCTICLIVLFQPFITIWTGGGIYLLDLSIVYIISINFYIQKLRQSSIVFIDCAGLMRYAKWKPIVEAVVNLAVSIALGKLLGLMGIFIGTIVSTVVAPLWVEPYVLYKHYFKTSVWDYWKRYGLYTFVTILIGAITWGICALLPSMGIWIFVAKVAICAVLPTTLYILVYFRTDEFKYFKNLFISIIKRRKKVTQISIDVQVIPSVDINNDGEADIPASIIENQEKNKND